MSRAPRDDQAVRKVRALRQAVEPVAAELRLIDVVHLITYIHTEQLSNVKDVVQSSIELFFKADTLCFGGGAEVDVVWNAPPSVILDMEFRHRGVWAVFQLVLRGTETFVIVEQASFAGESEDPESDAARMAEALADARLPTRIH